MTPVRSSSSSHEVTEAVEPEAAVVDERIIEAMEGAPKTAEDSTLIEAEDLAESAIVVSA